MSAQIEVWTCADCRQDMFPAFVVLAAASKTLLKMGRCPTCFSRGDTRSTIQRAELEEEEWEAIKAGGLAIFPPKR